MDFKTHSGITLILLIVYFAMNYNSVLFHLGHFYF